MIINQSKYNSHWQTKTLDNLGTFKRGKSRHRPRNDEALFKDGEYPLIQTGEIKEANLFISSHTAAYNALGLRQSKIWPENTLCITIAANIAETALLEYPMCFPDSVVGFNAYPEESSELFMHYVFTYIKASIQNSSSGSIQDNINIDYLTSLKFKIPPKPYQDHIVDVLSSIDKKIELNRKVSTTLKRTTTDLFAYWFIQFDFPDEYGRPYRSSGGKMVYDKTLKREIPAGWSVDFLANWIAHDKSGDWGKGVESGINRHRVRCVRGADINGLNGKGPCNPPVRFIAEKSTHKILEPNDIIIEISGGSPSQSTGRSAFITDYSLGRFDAPLVCSNFCKALTLKDKKNLYCFAYLWDILYDNDAFFGYEGKTSGIKNLLFDSFVSSYRTPMPEPQIAEKFYDYADRLERQRQILLRENDYLSELRDWLLPMLMNGQVSITDGAKRS